MRFMGGDPRGSTLLEPDTEVSTYENATRFAQWPTNAFAQQRSMIWTTNSRGWKRILKQKKLQKARDSNFDHAHTSASTSRKVLRKYTMQRAASAPSYPMVIRQA